MEKNHLRTQSGGSKSKHGFKFAGRQSRRDCHVTPYYQGNTERNEEAGGIASYKKILGVKDPCTSRAQGGTQSKDSGCFELSAVDDEAKKFQPGLR
jgi:hypothetical protein